MKKVAVAILIIALIAFPLAGCQKYKRAGRYITEKMIAPTFATTAWGMTPEEAFKALGTTELDWVKGEETDNQSNPLPFSETTAYYSDAITIYGVDDVIVKLEFGNAFDIGLTYVILEYGNNDKIGENIRSKIIDELGNPNGYTFSYRGVKQQRWGSPSADEIYTAEEWNDGEKIYNYFDEVNRRKKEVGIEPSDMNKNIFDPHDSTPLCFIIDDVSTRSFQFNGSYAAILNWDGKSHK